MNKADLERIEKIKKKHPDRYNRRKNSRVQNAENKQPVRKSVKKAETKEKLPEKEVESTWRRWGRKALWGLALTASMFFAKKAEAQTVKTTQKATTETVTKTMNPASKADTIRLHNASSMYNEILNMAVDELLANEDFVDNVVNDKKFIETISKNPELMAELCEKAGMNTIGNFDVSGFEWTPGYLQALKSGKNANIIINNIEKIRGGNSNDHRCLHAVNLALDKVGAGCHVNTVHQAIPMLLANPNLVHLENIPYPYNQFLPEGAVGAQDENPIYPDVVTGHIWVKKNVEHTTKKGEKIVIAEQVYGPKHREVPKDSMRNHKDDTWYGEMYILVHANDIVTRGNNNNAPSKDAVEAEDLLIVFMAQGRYKGDTKEMLVELGKRDQQALAILYIENTQFGKMYGLDQVPKNNGTSENIKVAKDQKNNEVNVNDTQTEESVTPHDVVENTKIVNEDPSNRRKMLSAKDVAAWFQENRYNA